MEMNASVPQEEKIEIVRATGQNNKGKTVWSGWDVFINGKFEGWFQTKAKVREFLEERQAKK